MKKYLLLLLFAFGISAYAQQFAIKTNLLYDAAITPNIGVEVAMKERQSAQAFYGFNNWNYGSDSNGDRKARHWLLMPEYRWWQCTVMNGWFVGIHGMTGEFNVGNIETILPGKFFNGIDLQNEAKSSRLEGGYLGGGYFCRLSVHFVT